MCRTYMSVYLNLNKIKKKYEHPFPDIDKQEKWEKCQQKIFSSVVVGAGRKFQCFIKNIWFLENKKALSKFLWKDFALLNQNYENIKNNQSIKPSFVLIMRANLTMQS